MTVTKQTAAYTALIEPGEEPLARILLADGREVLSFRLLTGRDVECFVDFLNDNRVEAAHVRDCFRDFLFDRFADPDWLGGG